MTDPIELWSLPDLTAKIAELEAILLSGVTTSNIDGTTETVDIGLVRQQLGVLNRRRDELLERTPRKPRVATIDVGGLF
ncbi:MAG: hypothetical protein JSS49_27455 [Planctomycetes bacterium]|nr:hypothetical protein [Planctomycetota bacterium]